MTHNRTDAPVRRRTDLPGDPDHWNAQGKSPEEIESDIEETRARMSEEIEAIEEKFTPGHIKQRAREAVQSAQEAVVDTVQHVASDVGRRTRETGEGLIELVRNNPLPATLIGVGVTWLFSRRRRGDSWDGEDDWSGRDWGDLESEAGGIGDKAKAARHKAGELTHEAGEKLDEVTHRVRRKARRAGNGLQGFFEENPVVAAAGVAVLGAVIGASIPRTRKEDELMGGVRDDLVDTARDVAEEARETVSEKMRETGESQAPETGRFSEPQRTTTPYR